MRLNPLIHIVLSRLYVLPNSLNNHNVAILVPHIDDGALFNHRIGSMQNFVAYN